jgi:hypothetical protein
MNTDKYTIRENPDHPNGKIASIDFASMNFSTNYTDEHG